MRSKARSIFSAIHLTKSPLNRPKLDDSIFSAKDIRFARAYVYIWQASVLQD
jgi:hypothetical protein